MSDCAFCDRVTNGFFTQSNEHAVAFEDSFPVTPGHTLVISRQHVESLFALTRDARSAMWALVDSVHEKIVAELAPDGFNIGVNIHDAGGQTVPHAHVHVIPRYDGDVDDPRGGVRWVIPNRAEYWDKHK